MIEFGTQRFRFIVEYEAPVAPDGDPVDDLFAEEHWLRQELEALVNRGELKNLRIEAQLKNTTKI